MEGALFVNPSQRDQDKPIFHATSEGAMEPNCCCLVLQSHWHLFAVVANLHSLFRQFEALWQ